MAQNLPTGDFVTSSLNGALTAGATSATIGTGLDLPATNGVLQIDYDSSTAVGADNGPETIKYTAYTSGTGALSGLTRGADSNTSGVAHANGASVQAGLSAINMGSAQIVAGRFGTPIAFRATFSATSINDATETVMPADTEEYDYGADYNNSTYVYTAQNTGVYTFGGRCNVSNVGDGNQIYIGYRVNGGTTVIEQRGFGSSAGSDPAVSFSQDIELTGADTLELMIFQNSGGAANMSGHFWAHLVGITG